MQIYALSNGVCQVESLPRGTVTVLGYFDGVHKGHAALVSSAKREANKRNVPLTVWSFVALPKTDRILTTTDEKLTLLSELGADYVVFESFDSVKDLSPDAFFDGYIRERISPCAIWCGFNFRYGKEAAGNAQMLARSAERVGISCGVQDAVTENGENISSTRIRILIENGAVAEANELLGHPITIRGEVMHGKALGRTLGFATLNQMLPAGKTIPKLGVYVSRVSFPDGTEADGITNIGVCPTVNPNDDVSDSVSGSNVTVETHALEEVGNRYGEIATVALLTFLRKEEKFASTDELVEQIKKDQAEAEKLLGNL